MRKIIFLSTTANTRGKCTKSSLESNRTASLLRKHGQSGKVNSNQYSRQLVVYQKKTKTPERVSLIGVFLPNCEGCRQIKSTISRWNLWRVQFDTNTVLCSCNNVFNSRVQQFKLELYTDVNHDYHNKLHINI